MTTTHTPTCREVAQAVTAEIASRTFSSNAQQEAAEIIERHFAAAHASLTQRVAELERTLDHIRELTVFRYAPDRIYELADSALAEKNAPARGETATKDSSGGAGVGVPTTKPCTRCGLTVGVQADGLCDACQGELRGYGFEGG